MLDKNNFLSRKKAKDIFDKRNKHINDVANYNENISCLYDKFAINLDGFFNLFAS